MGRPAIGERAMTPAERQRRRRERLKKPQAGDLDSLLDRLAGMTRRPRRVGRVGRNAFEDTEYLMNVVYNMGDPETQLPEANEFLAFFRFMDRPKYEDRLKRFEKAIVHLQVLLEVARHPPEPDKLRSRSRRKGRRRRRHPQPPAAPISFVMEIEERWEFWVEALDFGQRTAKVCTASP
jgi:hypothetical protein